MSVKISPLISIIIPTYNAGATLAVALESIINQTFKNWEVLIIDGLSTDHTIGIAEKFQNQFSNIQIFSEKDKGIYDAMNKGIDLAVGDWLYFMGSDDTLFDISVVENITQEIKQNNIDVVYGSICSTTYGSQYDDEFTFEKLAKKNIGHQAIFFNKHVFDVIGVFNLDYKALADWDHNIRWFFSSKIKKKYVNIVVANYAYGGYSDQHFDTDFNRNKFKILFKHGFMKLKRKDLIKITLNLINNSKMNKQYVNFLFYKIVFFILTNINRIKSLQW